MYIPYCKFLLLIFNALNRMLSVILELRINWYTNKGQTSSIVNECNVVLLRFVAQWDSISSVHKMIFFYNQSTALRDRTVL